MRSIVTHVAWSVCLFLLVTSVSRAKMAEPIEMLCGMSTRGAQGTMQYRWGPGSPYGKNTYGGHAQLQAYQRSIFSPYSLGGSSDAVYGNQYCSDLILTYR